MAANQNNSHHAYIKYFNRFICNKTKNKNKKHFFKYCLQCFSCQIIFMEHKRNLFKSNW